MVRSVAKQRISNHEARLWPPASFETHRFAMVLRMRRSERRRLNRRNACQFLIQTLFLFAAHLFRLPSFHRRLAVDLLLGDAIELEIGRLFFLEIGGQE